MEKGKRALVLMLSVLMLFSTFPASVFAGDEAAPEAAPAAAEAQEPVKEAEPEPAPQPEAPAEPAKEEAAPAEEAAAETPAEDTSESADPSDAEQTAEAEANPEVVVASEEEEVVEEEEIKYPAQTLKTTVSDGAVITVKAPEGAFPEGSKVKATPVSEEEVLALIDGAVEAAAYDITVYDKDGKEVQPNKSVKVSMANTGLSGADAVYHVNDSMTNASLVTENIDEASDSFTVNHFSIYTIIWMTSDSARFNTDSEISSLTMHVNDTVTLSSSNVSSSTGAPDDKWHLYKGDESSPEPKEGLSWQTGSFRNAGGWPNAGTYSYIKITAVQPGKYLLENWGDTIDGIPRVITITVKAQYTVTFDMKEHGTNTTKAVDDGDRVAKPADPTAEGYLFQGWYENADCTGSEFDFSTPITEDKTLYAKWAKSCTITFKDEDGTVLSEKQYGEGTPVSKIDVPTPSKDDDHDYFYDFAGWSPELVDVTDNAVYTATYSSTPKIYYTIHYERNCPDSFDSMDMPSNQVEAVKSGTSKPVVVAFGPSSYSAYFLGWTDNPEGEGTVYNRNGDYGSSKTITLGETDETSITLYAKWNYSIYFYPNGGDLGEVQQKIASSNPAGLTIPSETPKRKGYEFLGWSTSSKATEAEYAAGSTFTPKQFSTSLFAVWKISEYKIDYELNGGSLEEDATNPETYTVETATFKLNNPKKEGYMFKGWTGTGLDATSDEVIIANGSTGDRSYTATWKKLLNYQLEVTPISAGEKADYPTIKEKDGLSDNVSGSQWVTSQTELDKYKACFAGTSDDWDSIETYHEEFEPGDTYYALAVIRFDGDEVPDSERVKLVKSDAIKQAGDPIVRKNTNEVIIPFSATVPKGPSYPITYELNGGALEDGVNNPDSYTAADTFTLNNPVKEGYMFKGWTGTDLDAASDKVTIAKGSTGARSYTANWKKLLDYKLEVTPISAGEAVSAPAAKEADGKPVKRITGAAWWVETQDMINAYKECFASDSPDWDSIVQYKGTFKAGKTYYGLVSLVFEDDEDPDVARVTLKQTEYIKQAGDPIIDSDNNAVMIPFSATIPPYAITYNLDGGALEEGVINPSSYTEDDEFTLNNPVKKGFKFTGWTGTGLDEASTEVTISEGSTGNRTYTATWTELPKYNLKVAMIEAGGSAEKYPDVDETSGKENIHTTAWVSTATDLSSQQAYWSGNTSQDYDSFKGRFQAGETYYSVALVEFDEDDEADAERVSLVETDYIHKAGEATINESRNMVVVPFSVTIPAITVTVEFGSKHAGLAEQVAVAAPDGFPMTASGGTLTYKAEKGSDRWFDVTSPLRDAMHDSGIDTSKPDNGERMFQGFVNYNLKPLSSYKDAEECYADMEIAMASQVPQDENLKLYILWTQPTAVELTIAKPICGTEVTVDTSAGKVSSRPNITVTSGNARIAKVEDPDFSYDPTYWVTSGDSGYPEPFEGEIKGGETYRAMTVLDPEFGYYVDYEKVTVSVGKLIKQDDQPMGPERYTLIDVEADHEWGDWTVTRKPTTTKEGEEKRVCKHCDAEETRPIDKIAQYTITYDLNGGTLDGEKGKVTFKVEAGTEITLPEPTRKGYEFDYWKGSKYEAGDTYTVNGNHTFTAQWIAKTTDSKKSKGVDTGDAAGLMGWLLLGIAAEAGAVYMYRRRRDF